ncbi:MAG: hypothetical protein V4754_15065 [Pseudomonadota bacterium]
MSKSILFAVLCLLSASAAAVQPELTEVEQRWLKAAAPVLAYAKQIRLPVDIVVQPQASPDDVPLAMGFDGTRCKLVFSLRGNAQAEEVLEEAPLEQRALLIETMTAHEMGHCWRYAQGDWHVLPAGFVEVNDEPAANPALRGESRAMRQARREEGFSDLVALAWVQQRHPAQYGQVYAWLDQVRKQPVPGSSHDTMAWIRLAKSGTDFAAAGTPFEQARRLWSRGLRATD